jgi:hypothetical protein
MNRTLCRFIPAAEGKLSRSADAAGILRRYKPFGAGRKMEILMPTYIQLAYREPPSVALPKDLSAISIFLLIGLIQIAVAALAGDPLATFTQQTIW